MYVPSDYSTKKEQKSNSLIIGILILVISLILIGLYLVSGVLKGSITKNNSINNTIAANAGPGWKIGESISFSGTLTTRNDQSNFFQFGVKELDYIGMVSQKVNMSGLSGEFVFQGVVKDIKQFSGVLNTYIVEVNDIKPILIKSLNSSVGKLEAEIGNKSVFLDKDIIIANPNYSEQDGKLNGGDFDLDTFLCSDSSADPTKNCEKMKENESIFTNLQGVDFFRPLESSKYYFYTPRYGINFVSDDEDKAKDFANSIDIIDENYMSQTISNYISSVCNDGTTKIVRKETFSYDPIKSQIKINGYDENDNMLSCIVSVDVEGTNNKKLVFEFQSFGGKTNNETDTNSSNNQITVQAPTIYSSKSSIKTAVSSQSLISSVATIDLNNTNISSEKNSSISSLPSSSQGMNIDLNATSTISTSSVYSTINKDEKITSGAVTYSQYRSAQRGYTAIFPRNFAYEVGGLSQSLAEGVYCYNSITLANYNTQANGDDIRILACSGTGDANAYAASKGYRLYKSGNNFFFANALTNDGMQALNNISFK